ncbi:MAG: diadenylate cyclase CdaA [Rhodothermales bacterium]
MTLALSLFFVPIRLSDVIEVAIVSFILYHLYRMMRGTIGMQILLGLLALVILDNVVTAMNMRVLRALFSTIGEVFVLAIIILFQPEIRRALSLVFGHVPLMRRLLTSPEQGRAADQVIKAAAAFSRDRVGALIVFERASGLRAFIETGTLLESRVSQELLSSIFHPKSPLHDGAVIIQSGQIAAARCILPVSESKRLSPHLGLRHRAAVGISEQTDAFVLVVSEERGSISVAERGTLTSNLTEADLRQRLAAAFAPESGANPSLASADAGQ